MTMPAARALRQCDECGETDDKPHHQVVVVEEDGLRMVSRHFACCNRTGCPDNSCATILNGSQSGV